MPVKDGPQEEVKEEKTLTPDEAVAIYSKGLQDKLNARYASLAKRLESVQCQRGKGRAAWSERGPGSH